MGEFPSIGVNPAADSVRATPIPSEWDPAAPRKGHEICTGRNAHNEGSEDDSVSAHSSLAGIRVIELTHAISGPQCGQILADHGADVIKVEPPGGELAREAYPQLNGESVYFSCHNRGKRSIVLDLKTPGDLQILHDLVKSADAVLTNYTVDVPRRLGWGFEVLKELNPSIVMAHITGFGSTGPDRDLRALDGIIQAMSGVPSFSGTRESGPILAAAFVADHVASYHAALGLMFALYRRKATGEGGFVDISMLNSYASVSAHAIGTSVAGEPPEPLGNRIASSFGNTFQASDGIVFLSPIGTVKWEKFCHAIGREDWASDIPYESAIYDMRDYVEREINQWCAIRSRSQINKILAEYGIPCGPVQTPAEYANHAIETDSGGVVEVRSPAGQTFLVPGPVALVGLAEEPNRFVVPQIGEHTAQVLAELGITREQTVNDG